ncbi:MAG: phosphatase PAP2 family protein [Bacteroidia bacterium]|nr:phosphatase PAP2 family protein [Bacteroidia bacterium]
MYFSSISNNWIAAFKIKPFKFRVLITIPVLIILLVFITKFLTFNEYRKGIVISDPLLNLLTPVNLSAFTFGLTYFSVLFVIILLLPKPRVALITLNAYMLILIFRIITMYIFPLEPPVGIIPLKDVLLESSFYSGRANLKDLFFSGHTATIFLFFLVSENRWIKLIFILLTIIIASCVLLQHVHFTIDVIFAPFFSWLCYKLAQKLNRY